MGYDLSGLSLGGSGESSDSSVSVATQDPYGFDLGTLLPGDTMDTSKMQGSAADGSGVPWWQSMIQTGITRLIDNTTGPVATAGNANPGSFAGANGQSYPQDVAKRNAASVKSGGGMGMLLILGIAVLLLVK